LEPELGSDPQKLAALQMSLRPARSHFTWQAGRKPLIPAQQPGLPGVARSSAEMGGRSEIYGRCEWSQEKHATSFSSFIINRMAGS